MQEKILYNRNNQKLICFAGELLAQVNDRNGHNDNEPWIEVALYKTDQKNYILYYYLNVPTIERGFLQNAENFTSAEDVYIYLTIEGEDMYQAIDKLLEQASERDENFSRILRRISLRRSSRSRKPAANTQKTLDNYSLYV